MSKVPISGDLKLYFLLSFLIIFIGKLQLIYNIRLSLLVLLHGSSSLSTP